MTDIVLFSTIWLHATSYAYLVRNASQQTHIPAFGTYHRFLFTSLYPNTYFNEEA